MYFLSANTKDLLRLLTATSSTPRRCLLTRSCGVGRALVRSRRSICVRQIPRRGSSCGRGQLQPLITLLQVTRLLTVPQKTHFFFHCDTEQLSYAEARATHTYAAARHGQHLCGSKRHSKFEGRGKLVPMW